MIDCHTGAQRNRYENGRNPARCFRSYVELYHELDEENTHSISDAISCDKQNTTRRIRVVFLFFSKLRTVVLTDNVDHERSEDDHPAPSAIRSRFDLAVRLRQLFIRVWGP